MTKASEFREIANKFNAKSDMEKMRDLAKEEALKISNKEIAQKQAEAIFLEGLKKAEVAASSGRKEVAVYELKEKDFVDYRAYCDNRKELPKDLSGMPLILYFMFLDEGFKVKIDYCHDGAGIRSRQNLSIAW